MAKRASHMVFTVLLIITCLSLSCPSSARVREAKHEIYGPGHEKMVKLLPEIAPTCPKTLASDRDVYVFFRVGAGAMNVVILARPTADPVHLAELVDSWAAGRLSPNCRVEWSNGDEYAAVRLGYMHGKIGAAAWQTNHPVGSLTTFLSKAGFVPHTVLGRLLYTETRNLGAPAYRTKRYGWYDVTGKPADFSVTVAGRVPERGVTLYVAVVLSPIVFLLLWWIIFGLVTRNRLMSPAARGRAVQLHFLGPVFGVPILIVFLGISLVRTPYAVAISDVWFGSLSFRFLLFCAMMPAIVLMSIGQPIALRCLAVNQRRLAKEAGIEPEVDPHPVPAGVRKANLQQKLWRVGLLAAGLAIFLVLPLVVPRDHPLHPYLRAIGALVAGMGFHLLWAAIHYNTQRTERVPDMDDLYRRISYIAAHLGIRLKEVKTEEGVDGHQYVKVIARPDGCVLISRKAIEIMTPEELDFLVAYELLISPQLHKESDRRVLLFLVICSVPLALWIAGFHKTQLMWLLLVAPIVCLLFARRMTRRAKSARIDWPAGMMPKPEVAQSAMAKRLKYSELGNKLAFDPRIAPFLGSADSSPTESDRAKPDH